MAERGDPREQRGHAPRGHRRGGEAEGELCVVVADEVHRGVCSEPAKLEVKKIETNTNHGLAQRFYQ